MLTCAPRAAPPRYGITEEEVEAIKLPRPLVDLKELLEVKRLRITLLREPRKRMKRRVSSR